MKSGNNINYSIYPFSIRVKDKSTKIDIFGVISQFITIPDGTLAFGCKNSPDKGFFDIELAYPKKFEELEKYSKVIDPKKPVNIIKTGLNLTYFPENYRKDGVCGYEIFRLIVDLQDVDVLDRTITMTQLHDFPKEFFVFNEKTGYMHRDSDFLKKTTEILEQQLSNPGDNALSLLF